MKPWLKLCRQGVRFCGDCLVAFGVWSLWLALVILLGAQIYIVTVRELTLPPFILRAYEERLAASGVRLDFGRASFDPTGSVLLENVRLYLPAYEDPVAVAHTLHVTLDPWAMLARRFEPRGLDVTGVSLSVPAMLSPTGRNEALVHDLDFSLTPQGGDIQLRRLAGRIGNLNVTARGAVHTTPLLGGRRDAPLPLAVLLNRHYPEICRQLVALTGQLGQVETPAVDLLLTPSDTRGAIVRAEFSARRLTLPAPAALTATDLTLSTQLPLLGDAPAFARIETSVGTLRLENGFQAHRVQALVRGRLDAGARRFDFISTELTAAVLSAQRLSATDLALRAEAGPLPHLRGEAIAHVLAQPIAVSGEADLAAQSARLQTTGRLSPAIVGWLGQRLGRDLGRFIGFESAPEFDLAVNLDPGWKFTGAGGRVATRGVNAYGVRLDESAGRVDVDLRRFHATDARARLGSNFARGSFEQDFVTKDFRFLLRGRLDPPAIGGWFRDWWDDFWANFDFSQGAPVADVDVTGRWGRGPDTTVFVFAHAREPAIRGVALDHAITRLFIRPYFYDALELYATRGAGALRGTFTRTQAEDQPVLKYLAFDFTSGGIATDAIGRLIGPEIETITAPFAFTQAPVLEARGLLAGPAAPEPGRRSVRVTGATGAPLAYHGFPLQHLSFTAELRDDVVDLTPVEVGFGGGVARGRILLDGPESARRLGFDLSLTQANLREAALSLEKFSAQRRGQPPAPASTYIEGAANVNLDLALSASGPLDDPYGFKGTGRADLAGAGLGRIRLLGLLSELIFFTALDFDSLRTDFTIAGPKLVFPEINLTGPNAAISANGSYALAERTLDFNARIYPFQESRFILKNVVGAVLSPLSNVLEVKLGGPLEKPTWAFVIGPSNFLRNLSTPAAPATDAPAPDSPVQP